MKKEVDPEVPVEKIWVTDVPVLAGTGTTSLVRMTVQYLY
jgi:hypothetical protein